jgi:serine/threonine kinase 16
MGNKSSKTSIKKGYIATLNACGDMGGHQLATEGTKIDVKFVKCIGEGGFSTVHRVKETKTSKKRRTNTDGKTQSSNYYAVKRMVCKDDEWIVRCEEEIKMHRICIHKNILPLLGCSDSRLNPVATEYLLLLPLCTNGTLQSRIDAVAMKKFAKKNMKSKLTKSEKKAAAATTSMDDKQNKRSAFTEAECKFIFQGVIMGVHAIHQQHFTHRDIKPDNVLFSSDGTPMVMDLGSCAKTPIFVETSTQADLVYDVASTHSTPSYRAPELFMMNYPCHIDESTDVWSLGCLLYTMIFGRSPFEFGPNGSFERLAVMNGNVYFHGHGGLEWTRWRKTESKDDSNTTNNDNSLVVETTDLMDMIRGMLCPTVKERLTMTEVIRRASLWNVCEASSSAATAAGLKEDWEKEEDDSDSGSGDAGKDRDSWVLANDGDNHHEEKLKSCSKDDRLNEFEVNWENVTEESSSSSNKKRKKKKHKKKHKKKKEKDNGEDDFGEFKEASTKEVQRMI